MMGNCGHIVRHAGLATALVVVSGLSGCAKFDDLRQSLPFKDGFSFTDTFLGDRETAVAEGPALDPTLSDGSNSEIITHLMARPSVLRDGALKQVSDAVMAANSRRAESELRAAQLNSEAIQKNWLPNVGPNVSLNSLGNVAASLLINQALFDGGRRKAERAVSRADVEVAAVALAQNSNNRVRDALELYIDAEAAQARAGILAAGMERMEHFAWVMQQRVEGGVNDSADLYLVRSQLSQMRSDLASDREKHAAAREELAAMAAIPLDGVTGISDVVQADTAVPALTVLKAQAQSNRADAAARAAAAGFLPELSLNVAVTGDGVKPGLGAGIANGLGFGMGARRDAIEAERQAAQERVADAQELSNRNIASLVGRMAEAQRRQREAHEIARNAARNYQSFATQVEAGRRPVPDVISVFQNKLATERRAAELNYEVVRLRVQLAALQGVLVEGGKI